VEANYRAEMAAQAALPHVYAVSAILDKLVSAVDVARQTVTAPRWVNAINAGFEYLLRAETVEIDAHDALIYRSESGATYRANGTCQCKAYETGQPCKHRAAARLVHNALHA